MTHPGPTTYPPAQDPAAQDRWAEPRKRLHPLSPLLHSIKTLAVIIAAISIQGAVQLGPAGFVGTLMVVTSLAMGVSAISWLVTGYHVVGRELRIYDGVMVRRTRAIPLERLQAIEVVRPLLARVLGLAELRLEVVGGAKTEAPLAFLPVSDATALRERLLAIAGRVGAPAVAPSVPAPEAGPPSAAGGAAAAPSGAPVTGTFPPPAEAHLHSVVNREVVISQLLTPPVLFLPFAVALVVTQYWFGGAWSLVVLASMVVAIIGIIRQPLRRIMSNWTFRVALQESEGSRHRRGLRVRHGLTETRSQTVPLHRVQAVGVTWPLLWRHRRWLHARLDVAGYASPEEGVTASDQLLPVGDLPTARRLTAIVLPGVDLTALPVTPPPRQARWIAPVRQPVLGAGLTDEVYAVRDGRITRQLVIVPYARIQSVRVTQGPLQRLLGLASVHADTAGSLTATGHHRALVEAREFAAELTARAARARTAGQPVAPGADPDGGPAAATTN
jgi:putative membrane protein